jgi:hypothetical protein
MSEMKWSDRPDADLMQRNYSTVIELARNGGFHAPEKGWTAEQVVAHLLSTTEKFVSVGQAVDRGEQPATGDPDAVDDQVLARRTAEAGGLDGLTARLESASAQLVAYSAAISDGSAKAEVRFVVHHDGAVIADEMRVWGSILAGHASFHLPLHIDQLRALGNGA